MILFNNRPNGSIFFNTQGYKKMVIAHNSNVGLGTASPISKLHVSPSDVDPALTVENDDAGIEVI